MLGPDVGYAAGGEETTGGVDAVYATGATGVSGGTGPEGALFCGDAVKCFRGGGTMCAIDAGWLDEMSDVWTAVDVHVANRRTSGGAKCE